MKKVIWVITIVGLIIGVSTIVHAKKVEPVSSTEDYQLEQSVTQTTKHSKEDKSSWKQKRKENKIYFKNKKAIKKQDNKRKKQINEIEYLEKRLELKKKQLEIYQPNQEKGEIVE